MVRASLSQKELSGSHLNVSQAFLFGGENLLQNTGAQNIVLQCFCAFYITFAIKVFTLHCLFWYLPGGVGAQSEACNGFR